VLEIGCGDAANLLPLAYYFPESSFTGVDLARRPIARAKKQAAQLGLTNLSLQATDLAAIGREFGQFDYIVAHGLYSWIPVAARDALLAVCRARLAPHGVAFVSYNALPGRHPRQMLREMMFEHAGGAPSLGQSRAFLHWILDKNAAREVWQPLLAREISRMLDAEDGALFHDDLAPVNDPVYFSAFASHAARHRLQYLGEAELHQMFDHLGALAGRRLNRIEHEQHLDFLKLRAFRQTLLCRSDVRLRRHSSPQRMEHFLFSSPARLDSGQWLGEHGVRLSAGQRDADAVAQALADTWPLPVAFEDLVPYAASPQSLREILYGMATHGFVSLHTHDYPVQESVTSHPRASRLARLQAETSARVVNACHDVIELDEPARRLIGLLNGARDQTSIARTLRVPVDALVPRLKWMAHMALLES
jgi:SAM-dependent methyltransferase